MQGGICRWCRVCRCMGGVPVGGGVGTCSWI